MAPLRSTVTPVGPSSRALTAASPSLGGTPLGRTNGVPPSDGEAAVNARLEGPTGVTVDRGGAIYFVEAGIGSGTGLALGDYKVWKVSAAGVLTTLAGNGVAGFNGEVILPRNALLNRPLGVAADALGNWYLADTANSRIREAQPGGNLFTIAGNGNASYFGDGGAATKGSVNQPEGVAVDSLGNVYIADTLDHAVRRVTPDGVINTLAGTGNPGYAGDGGPAIRARLSEPRGVAVDADGNVYVADSGNNQVRRIDALGTITTVDTGCLLYTSP